MEEAEADQNEEKKVVKDPRAHLKIRPQRIEKMDVEEVKADAEAGDKPINTEEIKFDADYGDKEPYILPEKYKVSYKKAGTTSAVTIQHFGLLSADGAKLESAFRYIRAKGSCEDSIMKIFYPPTDWTKDAIDEELKAKEQPPPLCQLSIFRPAHMTN